MEELKNLTQIEALEISQNFPEQPMFNKVIITLNTDQEDDNDLQLSENTMSEFQYIIAKGTHCREITEGDMVRIDLEKMMIKEVNPENQYETFTKIKIDPIYNEYGTFAIIEDRFIKTLFKNNKPLQSHE